MGGEGLVPAPWDALPVAVLPCPREPRASCLELPAVSLEGCFLGDSWWCTQVNLYTVYNSLIHVSS